jgi:hypothetical protein
MTIQPGQLEPEGDAMAAVMDQASALIEDIFSRIDRKSGRRGR